MVAPSMSLLMTGVMIPNVLSTLPSQRGLYAVMWRKSMAHKAISSLTVSLQNSVPLSDCMIAGNPNMEKVYHSFSAMDFAVWSLRGNSKQKPLKTSTILRIVVEPS